VSSSNRRQREIAAARAQRRQSRVNAAAKRRSRNQNLARVAVVFGIVGGFLLVWNKPFSTVSSTATPTPSASAPTTSATPSPTSPPVSLPPSTTPAVAVAYSPAAGQYARMGIKTNVGAVTISLDNRAKKTVASMAALSGRKFFKNTICHRLTTAGIYVLQCGDPTGTGTGGPGYQIPDENLPSVGNGLAPSGPSSSVYPRGIVAMANSGPNTNGSQFFLVYKDSPLPPNYTVWGKVTSGLDVIDRVAAAGVAGGSSDGRPNRSVTITATSVK
jgi:peptidyl-prolyl cis-trans isomerase B (cyclophilin B)